MKAVIKLELIGDDTYQFTRLVEKALTCAVGDEAKSLFAGKGKTQPWVARIIGLDPHYHYKREFVRPQCKDYSEANSVGSRGVYAYYTLSPGIYEVFERKTWKRSERYFIRVEGDKHIEITEEDVKLCLKSAS